MATSKFNQWLVDKGHATSINDIEYELSAQEVDELFNIWEEETGGYIGIISFEEEQDNSEQEN